MLLAIVHRRLQPGMVVGITSGWDTHTGILADVLNGVEPRPFWTTHEKLAAQYAAAV